ncbi:MAG TPA: hypothetical protein VMU34_04130 [Mycobacterium sp.]|nr:hypothetical protein [Mycobacterium sp.]
MSDLRENTSAETGRRVRHRSCSLTMVIGLVMLGAVAASALTCPGSTSAVSITLTGNYTQNGSGDCFRLTGGSNVYVNMNGFRITCTAGACAGAAITTATGTTATVTDQATGNTGGIYGPWTYGVRNLYVQTLNIDGAQYAVYNDACASSTLCGAEYNVITNPTSTGIFARSPQGRIDNNFIDNPGQYGIDAGGATATIQIDHNFVRGYGSTGMSVANTVNGHENVIDRGDAGATPVVNTGGGVPPNWISTNICEDATWCPQPKARYILP